MPVAYRRGRRSSKTATLASWLGSKLGASLGDGGRGSIFPHACMHGTMLTGAWTCRMRVAMELCMCMYVGWLGGWRDIPG